MSVKRIPLHDTHVNLGGKMVDFAGFEMPVRYSSDIEEHMTVRSGVGVFDVSHMGEFLVEGDGAFELVQWVTSNDVSKLEDGNAQYSCLPNNDGGIVDDLIVYRMEEKKYFLVVNASNIEKDWNWIESQNRFGAKMTNLSDDYCLFAVQGPQAQKLVQKLTSYDLESIAFYSFGIGDVAGIKDVIISATGYTGAGGFELYCKSENAVELWKKIFDAGEEFGIKPIGLGARDTLRMEMGYCLYGNDIDDKTSPLEAGLGWITKFDAPFVNSESLKKQKEEGVTQRLTGIRLVDRGIPRQGYEIVDSEGNTIGRVTSGTHSPILKSAIGLGYIKKEYAKAGNEVFIRIRNRDLKAETTRPPFVKGTL